MISHSLLKVRVVFLYQYYLYELLSSINAHANFLLWFDPGMFLTGSWFGMFCLHRGAVLKTVEVIGGEAWQVTRGRLLKILVSVELDRVFCICLL